MPFDSNSLDPFGSSEDSRRYATLFVVDEEAAEDDVPDDELLEEPVEDDEPLDDEEYVPVALVALLEL